jgi:hypothetical protein
MKETFDNPSLGIKVIDVPEANRKQDRERPKGAVATLELSYGSNITR